MSTASALGVPVATALLRLGVDYLEGRVKSPGDAARTLVGIGLQMVPHDELARYLTEAARRRAEFAADLAEAAKFGQLADNDLDEDDPDTHEPA